jgi:UDP-glucose 4-epimerase
VNGYKYLVTGGLGYIGSNFVFRMLSDYPDSHVTVLDNQVNCKGNDKYLKKAFGPNVSILIGEIENITTILKNKKFDVVVHLGANAYVGESVKNPNKYFGKNVNSTYALAQYCKKAGVKHIIFSSTCAVYGSYQDKIEESAALLPASPYGYSKLFSELVLKNEVNDDCSLTVFRFFNVAGANIKFKGGEFHVEETHLIPVLVNRALAEKEVFLFGGDYDTPDGTCLREYVHVADIVEAHMLSIKNRANGVFNLGCSKPISNFEVLRVVEKQLDKKINYSIRDRRHGDAISLFSCNQKAERELGWSPVNSNIEKIIRDYINWVELER